MGSDKGTFGQDPNLVHPLRKKPLSIEDPQVVELVEQYISALEAGNTPDRESVLARYPELAEDLAACLDGLEIVLHVAPQVSRQSVRDDASEPAPYGSEPSRTLGEFRLLREIGRGGMGVVYEAEQISLQRRVALKVLPFAAVLKPTQLQRFQNEVQATATLDHPNIVRVFSVGCDRGVHYFAMQFIEGQTLGDAIKDLRKAETERLAKEETSKHTESTPENGEVADSPDSEAESTDTHGSVQAHISTIGSTDDPEFFRSVAQLGIQVAEALGHGHKMGIVHRDVKPSNLMLDAQGHLYVTDFGLAHVQSETGLTMSGDVLGTLRYMSPEQAAGERRLMDHRTDIYSLGATLYELLALKPAFSGEDRLGLLEKVVEGDPQPLRTLNEAIPVDLETIVLKAMAKEPQARYASAKELAADLRRYLDEEEIRAKDPSLTTRAKSRRSRRRRAIGCAADLLIPTAILLTLVFLFLHEGEDADMNSTKSRIAALVVAVNAMLGASSEAKKPPKPPPEPGLTVHYQLLGADPEVEVDTLTMCGSLVQQSDGKYLTAGCINFDPFDYLGPLTRAQVTRWNADGSVDAGFGNDFGRFIHNFGGESGVDVAWDVKVQIDGKIVLVGASDDYSSPWIARLNPDGSFDTGFGNGGVVDDILVFDYAKFYKVTLLSDGSMVAVGDINDPPMCPLLVKFAPDGSIDESFGEDGISVINLGEPSIVLWGKGFTELPDGRLIAPGAGADFDTSAVFMLLPNGWLDPSFGNGGLAEMDFERGGAEYFHDLTVRPDGKIVAVGGTSTDPSHYEVYHGDWILMEQFNIARFNADGTKDRKFVRKGGRQLDLAPGGGCEFTSVELLSDGKILAAGCGDPGIDGTRDIYLARFLSNGNLDESFDQDGWININMMGDETGIGLQVINDHFYLISATGVDPDFGMTQFLGHVWEE